MVKHVLTGHEMGDSRERAQESKDRARDRRERMSGAEQEEKMSELEVEQRAEAQAAEMAAEKVRQELGEAPKMDDSTFREMMNTMDQETGMEVDITYDEFKNATEKVATMRRDLDDAQARAQELKSSDSFWNRLRGGSEATKKAKAEVAALAQELGAFESSIESVNNFAAMYMSRLEQGEGEMKTGSAGKEARSRMRERKADEQRRAASAGRGRMT